MLPSFNRLGLVYVHYILLHKIILRLLDFSLVGSACLNRISCSRVSVTINPAKLLLARQQLNVYTHT